MGILFGALGMSDLDRPFTIVQGQEIMYRETQMVFQRWNADAEAAMSLFVQETTDTFKERFKLPGGGLPQTEDVGGGTRSGVSKSVGQWDVAFPLEQTGDALSWPDVTLKYMTLQEYENHVQTVLNKNNNGMFRQILRAIFRNTTRTVSDDIHGNLTVQPLANTDGTLYPPVFGSEVEAEETMYLAPGYNESGINNTNNPFVAVRNKLEPHYGFPEGGSPIVVLCNTSAVPYARALAGFDEYTPRFIDPGDDVSTLTGLPALPGGGRIVGHTDNVLIFEWPRIPSGWMLGVHLDAPKPLKRRRDPLDTGLDVGLQLVSQTDDRPFQTSRWRNRQGFGVGNRIGAVAVALNGTSSYTVPTAYNF